MSEKPITYIENGIVYYRASVFGLSDQALVASRLGYAPLPVSDDLQQRFDDGHMHEEAIKAKLITDGFKITNEQKEIEVKITDNVSVRGHYDWDMESPVGRVTTTDAKSMSDDSFKKWIKDRFNVGGYVTGYGIQLGLYGKATGLETCLLAKNKNNGKLDFYYPSEDEFNFTLLKLRILKIEAWVKKGELPPSCGVSWGCPYSYLHDNNEEEKPKVHVESSEEVEGLIQSYLSAKAKEDEGKKAKETARDKLNELLPPVADVTSPTGSLSKVQTTRRNFNLEGFKSDHPEFDYDEYISTTVSSKITVKPPKKEKVKK